MLGLGVAGELLLVVLAGAAEADVVGVEDLEVVALARDAHLERLVKRGIEVDEDDQVVIGVLAVTDERDDGLLVVVGVDPLEAVLGVGELVERRLGGVEMVQRLDELLVLGVGLVLLGEEPLDRLVIAPLDELGDLVAHEVELGARMGHLVEGERAQARELAPPVARHASDQRALAVNDLVV